MSADRSERWASRLQRAWASRGVLACCLWPLSLLFAAVAAVRRAVYRRGWLRTASLPVPVVVVGNLIAGGAGKTPTVIAVVALLRQRGFTPGIVSRGYGRHDAATRAVDAATPVELAGDEPLLLHLRTGAPVQVGRDRAAAARALLQRAPRVDIIVSDDGLQHLKLPRTAQVLVFDERGAGNGWLLPAGPLRERLPARVPARSVVLYNAPVPSTPLPGALARRSLGGVLSLSDWWRTDRRALRPLAELRGRPLLAVAGVARPERFFTMLRQSGLDITPLALADHHDFAVLPWPADNIDVIVTEKDAVKLKPGRAGTARVWVAALDFEPGRAFDTALLALLPDPPETADDHGNPIA